MKKSAHAVLFLSAAVLTLAACGVLQEPEAATGPIEAIPLSTSSAGVAATDTPSFEAEPTESQTSAATTEAVPTEAPPTEEPTAADVATVFAIDPATSQVRFQLDEDLRGVRTTVVGTTSQVAGELSVSLADLTQTQVGVIQINARTLATDNNFRNRAIQNEILDTDQFEFISFMPTGIEGLPASIALGETATFSLVGELTIRDVTLPATFTVEATAVSDSQIAGTASAVVNRADFGLQIPSVPNVANVEEEVELYIDFTANAS
jgi:polyisoprenoid-binding protein YceI